MRVCCSGAFIVAPTLLLAAASAADATTFETAFLEVSVDGAVSSPLALIIDERGGFRGSFSLVACDGSVREATVGDCAGAPAGSLLVNVTGSAFPFVDLLFGVTDFGAPSLFAVSVNVPISAIAGPVTTELSGEITLPAKRMDPGALETILASDRFFEGSINGALVASLGEGPIPQPPIDETTFPFGPLAGLFDCGGVGGCSVIGVTAGMKGLGDGQFTLIRTRFDVDPAAPVPLPAPAALLLAGLGALGALRAARRG